MLRRTLPARRLAAAAVLPMALTTLAACGSDDGESTAADPSSESSEASGTATPSEDAGGAAPATGEEVEPAAFMDTFKAAFDDASTVHTRMAMTTALGEMAAEGDTDYSVSPPATSMSMTGAALQGQQMDLIMADGAMFMKMDAMGPKWNKIALDDPANPFASLTGQLDPSAMFDRFGDSITSVTHVGEEDIDGESVDSYEVSVDTDAVLGSQGQSLPQGVDIPEAVTYTVSFDDDGLFRRMQMSMGEGLGDLTVDFTDWGSDVSIEAPPADQVTDFDMGSLMGGAATTQPG